MERERDRSEPESARAQAVQHVVEARETLDRLRHAVTDLGHREALDEALLKLETALSLLAVKTGGML